LGSTFQTTLENTKFRVYKLTSITYTIEDKGVVNKYK